MGLNINLIDQLTFYGGYHSNKWNQLIHFFFVPLIFWTTLVWLAYTPEAFKYDVAGHLPSGTPECIVNAAQYARYNGAYFMVLGYSLYYIVLEWFAGLTWTIFMGVPLWISSVAFQQLVPHAWAWAIGLHIFAWFMQVVPGHAWIEGRKPALLDSLFQSLILAPLFVWFELLFHLGYRPELYQQITSRIRENLAARQSQQEPLLRSTK